MAISADPALLLSAFVRMTRALFEEVEEQVAWLMALQQAALIGSSSDVSAALTNLQDWGATGVNSDSSSTQWLRAMDAATIASLCESALQRIEADDAAGGAANADHGSAQYSDFSGSPSMLG